MATEAVPQSVAVPRPPDPALPMATLPLDAVVVDASASALPIEPLGPVELTPLPEVSRLARISRAAIALLTHPYPHRAPLPPKTREEQLAFAGNERARLERERQAYRRTALGGPIR